MSDELEATIAAVWARHRATACAQLVVVRSAAEAERAGGVDHERRVAAAAEAHKLAGALGVYGFPHGSHLCLRAEQALRSGAAEDAAALVPALEQLHAELAQDELP